MIRSVSRVLGVAALVTLLWSSAPVRADIAVDKDMPDYTRVSGVAGSIKSVGSDTMNNLMTLWLEEFLGLYPNVQGEIEGKGSSTAPPALTEGTSNFGPMSRAMKDSELDAFEKSHGYKPTGIVTAIDCLAVYVHKDNPIAKTGLTLEQADAIFSKTAKRGHKPIRTWGDLGLTGEWKSAPISLYGRNSASGTYGYFKKNVLSKGDFKDEVKEQPGSASVIQGIASDKFGIGYSGIGYKTADVAALSLQGKDGRMYEPSATNAYNGKYPLARGLWLYVNLRPKGRLDPLRAEFLKFILSRRGQGAVARDGYFPIKSAMATKSLRTLGLE